MYIYCYLFVLHTWNHFIAYKSTQTINTGNEHGASKLLIWNGTQTKQAERLRIMRFIGRQQKLSGDYRNWLIRGNSNQSSKMKHKKAQLSFLYYSLEFGVNVKKH